MQESEFLSRPIIVIGAGAVGGTIGANLAQAGYDVLLVDSNREHVERMRQAGLRFTGDGKENVISVRSIHTDDLDDIPGAAFLCVKAHHTLTVMQEIGHRLAETAFIVSMQNGLNEKLIASIIGIRRTVGAFVHFGADYLGAGHILTGQSGPLIVGELDGTMSPRITALRKLLNHVYPSEFTSNIMGYLWSKLCYSAMIYVVSTVDAPVSEVLDCDLGRKLCRLAVAEAYQVATTQVQHLEVIGEFNPYYFAPADNFVEMADSSLMDVAEPWRSSVKQHMGPWRDLKIKQQKTEVDTQIGVVVEHGLRLGIATPVNAATLDVFHQIENGKRQLCWSNLELIATMASEG